MQQKDHLPHCPAHAYSTAQIGISSRKAKET